ncbi:MAG: hypothetical protein WBV61_05445 [Rhodanobacteraceae bacterium]
MAILRARVAGDDANVEALVNTIHGLDEVVRLEEVDSLMLRARDDSSSAGLPDDVGSGLRYLEIGLADEDGALPRVKRVLETLGREQGLALEIVDRF